MLERLQRANWRNDSKRRVTALAAFQNRDWEVLWSLLEYYLLMFSKQQSDISPRTLESYRYSMLDFLEWAWPQNTVAPKINIFKAGDLEMGLYVEDLQKSGSHLSGKKISKGTLNLRMAGLRQFYKALAWAEVATPPKHIRGIKDPTPPDERRPALPEEDYKKLVRHIRQKPGIIAKRDLLLVRLAGECGLRLAELVGLRLGDVDTERRQLKVLGKGKKQRTVPYPKTWEPEVREWLTLRELGRVGDDDHLFLRALPKPNKQGKVLGDGLSRRGVQAILQRYYADLEIKGFAVHSLRHTCGVRFYRGSRDLGLTARLLGHSNINTSAIYAKVGVDEVDAVLNSLPPLG